MAAACDIDSSGDECEEVEEDMLLIQCLFCDHQQPSHEAVFSHMKSVHEVDVLKSVREDVKLGMYDFIKLVNYVRKNKISSDAFSNVVSQKLYDNDEYLIPFMVHDHMLMFGTFFEDEPFSN